jgi:hypothetical protein
MDEKTLLAADSESWLRMLGITSRASGMWWFSWIDTATV